MKPGGEAGVRRLVRHLALAALVAVSLPACSGGPPSLARAVRSTELVQRAPGLAGVLPRAERPAPPDLDGASDWLNVDRPLRLADLAGRIVVVDFWTRCCVNCMHTLPVLARLEARLAKDPAFVVVGVHSPKFDDERELEPLREFVRDRGIRHPVALDREMGVWRAWGVQAWPTVAVLDERGRIAWAASGEPDEAELSKVVDALLADARALAAAGEGRVATTPLRGLRPEPAVDGPLRYPAKVAALSDGRLAVSDTGHHRVVILDANGERPIVVGSGEPGAKDGPRAQAEFDRPEGLAELDGGLFVADAGTHLVRRVDLTTLEVRTVAGDGRLGAAALADGVRDARAVSLRSPWDVLAFRGRLIVALAGSHQLAELEPREGKLRLLAGSGREARADGELLRASFAQPSGLASDGKRIFVLDSETSSVRAVDPDAGVVRTLVGEGLFDFGDVDGPRAVARLQHPVGLAHAAGALWVADTFNSKIKRVDPATGEVRTFLSGLGEPQGLAPSRGGFWIADTNRHRVVRAELSKDRLTLAPPR